MSVLMPILLPLFLDPVAFSFFSRHRDPALAMRRKHKVFVALLRHVQRNARLKWMFSSEGKHGLSSNTNSAVQLGGGFVWCWPHPIRYWNPPCTSPSLLANSATRQPSHRPESESPALASFIRSSFVPSVHHRNFICTCTIRRE